MKDYRLKLPGMILAIGLALAVVACLFTCILKTPSITEHDFHYAATYRLNGETKTIEGVYRCQFLFPEGITAETERYYEGYYLESPSGGLPESHTISKQNDLELRIVFSFTDRYLMGDFDRDDTYEDIISDPYLAVYDREGYEYHDSTMLEQFDAELLSWETPQPVDNTFVFSGFSLMNYGSMLAILVAGLLTILAIMIAIKRDKTMQRKLMDKVSIVLSFAICLLGIPFFTIIAALLELTMNGEDFLYQLYLCIPAITAFTVAAAVALRRNGYTKTGFFVQLVGPAMFFVPLWLESMFYNIFE